METNRPTGEHVTAELLLPEFKGLLRTVALQRSQSDQKTAK